MGHICKACGIEKDDTEYKIKSRVTLKSGIVKEYRNSMCTLCRNASNVKQRTERYPHAWIRNRYLVDDAAARYWYERSMTSCEICGIGWKEGKEKLCIDHDHATGKLRGILCKHCNHVLGHSREQIRILDNAKAYLTSHREK